MNLDVIVALYSLLYRKPIFQYTEKDLRVAIVGDQFIDQSPEVEALKAIYWCGQMGDDYKLSVALLGEDPETTKKNVQAAIPAFVREIAPIRLSFYKNDQTIPGYRYIIIARDKPQATDEAFSQWSAFLRQSSNAPALLFALNGSKSFKTEEENGFYFQMLRNADLATQTEEMAELNRLAFNCDFAYQMSENERCKRVDRDAFCAPYNGTEEDNNRFYNYINSLPFPISIPYKLKIVADQKGVDHSAEAMRLLQDVILNREGSEKQLYNQLLDVEHRRWCAKLAADSWKMPTDSELQFAFAGSNTQKIKEIDGRKVQRHPCLCAGSKYGCIIDQHPELWKIDKPITTIKEMRKYLCLHYPDVCFSDLEIVTLTLHSICCQRAKEVWERTNGFLSLRGELFKSAAMDNYLYKIIEDLELSLIQLNNDQPGAVSLYARTLHVALDRCEEICNLICRQKLLNLDRAAFILQERAKHKNYYTIDSTMINMIPFVEFYGKEYRTVLTVSFGNPADDVKLPTLLCADTAVFLINSKNNTAKYQEVVKSYFKNRGNYTKPVFLPIEFDNRKQMESTLLKSIETATAPVINGTIANTPQQITILISYIASRKKIPILFKSTDADFLLNAESIEDLNGKLPLIGLSPKSFSVKEYTDLIGATYTNAYELRPFLQQFRMAGLLMQSFGTFPTSTINALSEKLRTAFKNETPVSLKRIESSRPSTPIKKTCEFSFSVHDFNAFNLHHLLNQLLDSYIIEKPDGKLITLEASGTTVSIRFTCYDLEIENYFKELEDLSKNNTNIKMPVFSLTERVPLKFIPLYAENAFTLQSEAEKNVDEKHDNMRNLLSQMEKAGFLSSLRIEDNRVSLQFPDFQMLSMFKNSGLLLELFIYSKIIYGNTFSDIQTHVKVKWSEPQSPAERSHFVAEAEAEKEEKFGLQAYKEAFDSNRISKRSAGILENEIDIIALFQLQAFFISIKNKKVADKLWIYEISQLARHGNAIPILIVAQDLTQDLNSSLSSFINCSKHNGVSLLGAETIYDDQRFYNAMIAIRSGKTVIGSETV